VSANGESGGKLGFLDSLGQLFRSKKAAAPAPETAKVNPFDKLETDFESAIARVNQQIEERRRASPSAVIGESASAPALTPQQRAAERAQRIETTQREMREDIEKKHAQLGTGISGSSLTELAAFLRELESATASGRSSQALVPRTRYAIGEKLRAEAGELAVSRLVALLQREKQSWPDPTRYAGTATEEEIERSRRRRLGEVREAFLGAGFERSAERMFGIVRGWGGDYPDRGTPLWDECVLEGVAAAIRAQLLEEFVEVLRRDRDALLAQIEASIGKQIEAVHALLKTGVTSIDDASQVVSGPLRVIDDLAPKLAWEHIRTKLPSARGETAPR
jgi:hypothetical protein